MKEADGIRDSRLAVTACVEPGCGQPREAAIHKHQQGHFFNNNKAQLTKESVAEQMEIVARPQVLTGMRQVLTMNNLLEGIMDVARDVKGNNIDLDAAKQLMAAYKLALRAGDLSLQQARIYQNKKLRTGDVPVLWQPDLESSDGKAK